MEPITSTTITPASFSQSRGYGEIIPPATEAFLVDSALQGRDEAFWDLVRPHLTCLNRFARIRLRNDPDAEDIAQQAVLSALSHLRQFRGEASFKTWLIAIASNEVCHRRRAAAGTRPLREGPAANLQDPAHAPDVQLQRRQEVERLHQALTRLPEKYRRMIQLRDLHELSVAETARSLSLTAAAVRTTHHRARKLLASSLNRINPAA
jgi:RNA polymerase sigma-70 factor (ECF subfamily)